MRQTTLCDGGVPDPSDKTFDAALRLGDVRAIFFFELLLEFVSLLDMKFEAPVRYRRSPYIAQTRNLSIGESLNLYFFTNKFSIRALSIFHRSPW